MGYISLSTAKKLCYCLPLCCVCNHTDYSCESEPLHTAEFGSVLKFSKYNLASSSTVADLLLN